MLNLKVIALHLLLESCEEYEDNLVEQTIEFLPEGED